MKTKKTTNNQSVNPKDQEVAMAPITIILATMAMCVFWMTHP